MVAPRYYLLEVVETNGGGQGVDEGRMPPVPRIFYSPVTLAELDDAQLVEDSLRAVTGIGLSYNRFLRGAPDMSSFIHLCL